ncbi:MAG: acyl-[acyl-carrier-protein]--UDP-N-acetylglucosamine O-acyltransferase [Rickettsiales bacterium]|nr:acyl-[acyl-carrier-protein]--UDP-N-acetylglucosamine O-acyltransferase [Rickettsiales bacterium]|tara:strand:- start:773 stop:1549 length:777 start_codon:yes stop_codon:yes gene_type:complete
MNNSSIIHDNAKLGKNVKIGPFCFIGENVTIQDNCTLHSHVVVDGNTTVMENSEIFPFASIGTTPQDLKYKGEKTRIVIGKNCKIREYVTVNLGTKGGGGITSVGDNCLLMIGTHIAHDCFIDDNVIFANHSTLAGHVTVEKNVVVGALSAIHQFSRIGEGSMIGGMSGITSDVIPFTTVMGNRAKLSGLNLVGLKRNNFKKSEINELRRIFKYLFYSNEKTLEYRLNKIREENQNYYTITKIFKFLESETRRSFCMP